MAIRLSGMASGLDTEAMVQELVSSYNIKKESYQKEQTRMEWKQEKWKELNSKIYKFYTGSLSNMKLTSAFNKKKTVASDANKATVLAASNAITGTQSLVIKELASSGYLTGADLSAKHGTKITSGTKLSALGVADGSIKVTMGNGTEKSVEVKADMTVSEFVSSLKGAGLNVSFDEKNQRFFVSSKESGAAADFTLSDGGSGALAALGLNYNDADGDGNSDDTSGAIKLAGTDAVIELNGAEFKSSNNTFSINGLTIEVKEKSEVLATDADGKPTQYAATTLSTSMDVDAVYDMVKDFLKEYNELIKEMDTLYGADSSRGYDPLTSEEKEAMTEEEIEKWESKIKDSLLRRDTTVSSITNMLKNTMAGTYEIDGKNYSLSSFGINTLSYFIAGENEKGVYHIDGDADDDSTSGNNDKLKAMIATDPDTVTAFFKKLGTDLYNKVNKQMQSTTLSSAFTVYNDKQMDTELNEIKKKITDWEEYVADQEDYWYKKFSAMEKALAELQSSTSAISGLFGMNQ